MASLRDIGYDTPAAVADLVDNSIDADARNVDITLTREGRSSWIRVADDGIGMTARELDEAMRYGSRREYARHHLGHFGLGLKTASLSQCRRLTVMSKTTPRGRIEGRCWDLDHVAARDSWELERVTPRGCPAHASEPLRIRPGTVVLWERLDRVLSYARPDGAAAMRAIDQLEEDVGRHLGMVFHRFLAGELGRGRARLQITLNDQVVEPWDPFARGESATQTLEAQTVLLRHGGRSHRVRVRPYILPPQIQFSSSEAHAEAAGPRRWNRQQGLYIYRRDRLIQSGGWNRLRTLDEHSKLARIALDIPQAAEPAFQINVSKMSVVLPTDLRPALAAVAAGVVAEAQEAYRQRVRLVDSDRGARDPSASVEAGSLVGDGWSTIVEVLREELHDQPETLRRVLTALANAHTRRTASASA
ncbi:MAG TPA: ATP-binding protein [Thermoleophilaceae bacterium]|nr:ATP-binding protein [Thermoleophilaceae bacterium]